MRLRRIRFHAVSAIAGSIGLFAAQTAQARVITEKSSALQEADLWSVAHLEGFARPDLLGFDQTVSAQTAVIILLACGLFWGRRDGTLRKDAA